MKTDYNIEINYLTDEALDLLNEINLIFLNKLYLTVQNDMIDCNINIDNFYISSNNSCEVEIINMCDKNKNLSYGLLLESIKEVLLKLDEEKRNTILQRLKININDLTNVKNNGLIGHCKAYAETVNTVDIKNMILPKCITSENRRQVLRIINTGSVDSNCFFLGLTNALSVYNNIFKDDELTEINGLTTNIIIKYICIIFIFFIIIYIIYLLSFFSVKTIININSN